MTPLRSNQMRTVVSDWFIQLFKINTDNTSKIWLDIFLLGVFSVFFSRDSKPNDALIMRCEKSSDREDYRNTRPFFRCVKMENVFEKARERRAMQRFSHSGLALLPWTRQILTALWENVRLMLQVICCSLMAGNQVWQ